MLVFFQNLFVPDVEARVALLAPLLTDPVKAVRLAAVSQLAGAPDALFEPDQLEACGEVLDEYVTTMEYSLDFAHAGLSLGNRRFDLFHRLFQGFAFHDFGQATHRLQLVALSL